MKKIVLLVVLLSASLVSFAQSSFENDIVKLMNAKDGMKSVNSLPERLAENDKINNKDLFLSKANSIKEKFVSKTIETFKTTYTHSQIKDIYNEFHSDEINYTDQTNNFFRFFRKLKGEFSRDMKKLYFESM